jgi:hypothetical protein
MVITALKQSFMVKINTFFMQDVSSVTCDFAPCIKEDGNICPYCNEIDFEDRLITCRRPTN